VNEEERAELVRRGVAAWNAGDLDALLALLDPGGYVRTSGAFVGMRREYRGHDEFREFWEDFRGSWETIEVHLEELDHVGPAVLATAHFRGIGREGLELEQRFHCAFELDRGRILGWTNSMEREQVLETAQAIAERGSRAAGA